MKFKVGYSGSIESENNDIFKCKICGKEEKSAFKRNRHLKIEHDLTFEEYIMRFYFNNIYPECKCGCGTKLPFNCFEKGFFKEFTTNHWPHKNHTEDEKRRIKESLEKTLLNRYDVKNPMELKIFREKIKQTKEERYNDKNYNNSQKNKETLKERYGITSSRHLQQNKKNSKQEKEIANIINGEHKFIFHHKEFDIRKDDTLIELDGSFYHPKKIENLCFTQLSNIINDYNKNSLFPNDEFKLIRIRYNDIPENISLESLIQNQYFQDHLITYFQVILSKEYLKRYQDRKGTEKLRRYVPLLLKFIRTFQPILPYPTNDKNIDEIVKKIQNYNFLNVFEDDTFYHVRCASHGISYLKAKFNSFWKSSFYKSISPEQVWLDDDIMKKVIEYRIGLNKSNEVFDFSLKNLVGGIAARRFTVSFFKPVLAAAIYRQFIGNKKDPVVIDPCAGFGGRMLGFKSIYPDGTYIGIEPNKETYNELVELSNNFSNVYLYNCKLEDYNGDKKCNLTFTSIPYYNNEIYSDQKIQTQIDWINMMKVLTSSFQNVLLNMSLSSFEEFSFEYSKQYFINSSTSHFNQKQLNKNELLIKI